jgi:hypothetical protein
VEKRLLNGRWAWDDVGQGYLRAMPDLKRRAILCLRFHFTAKCATFR